MRNVQPPGASQRVIGALVLLVAIAIGARVVYGLLAPLVPFVVTLIVLAAVYAVLLGRHRR